MVDEFAAITQSAVAMLRSPWPSTYGDRTAFFRVIGFYEVELLSGEPTPSGVIESPSLGARGGWEGVDGKMHNVAMLVPVYRGDQDEYVAQLVAALSAHLGEPKVGRRTHKWRSGSRVLTVSLKRSGKVIMSVSEEDPAATD